MPDRYLKDPLLEKNGLWIEFRGGDVCDPVFGNWFSPPWPKYVIRFFCKYPVLPWISWRIGKWVGYVGFKAYGADPKAYLNWMPAEDVYLGSDALCLSARPFASKL